MSWPEMRWSPVLMRCSSQCTGEMPLQAVQINEMRKRNIKKNRCRVRRDGTFSQY